MPSKKVFRGRPKDQQKRLQIVRSAIQVFMQNGLRGATMEDIAQHAGVSKYTLYSHFENKDDLFAQILRHRCQEFQLHEDEIIHLSKLGARQALTRLGQSLATMLMQKETAALHRVIVSESIQNPDFGKMFLDVGPNRVKCSVANLLKNLSDTGELDVTDPAQAAGHLVNLYKGELHFYMTLNLPPPKPKEIQAHIADVVELFLRAYGKRTA